MSPAIIPKLSALASTKVPKTTKMNVRSFVSRSVVFASASMARPPTSGIAEYVARLVSILCHASRLRSESTSTETIPIITAGAGPHSAIASTSAKNAPLIRSALCWIASRSLTTASPSSTSTRPTGCQSATSDDATAATRVPSRTTASPASSLFPRAGISACERKRARGAAQIALQIGQRDQQLTRGARAELEALEPVRLVRRVDVVVGQREAADDGRDRARRELGHDRDRAAGAHQRGRRQVGLEQRRVGEVPLEAHVGVGVRALAEQPLELRSDVARALAGRQP